MNLLIALVVAIFANGQETVQAPPAVPRVEAWVRYPIVQYPSRAYEAGVRRGSATIRCFYEADGTPRDCEIIRETPEGVGFGLEALRAVRASQRQPAEPGLADVGLGFRFTN